MRFSQKEKALKALVKLIKSKPPYYIFDKSEIYECINNNLGKQSLTWQEISSINRHIKYKIFIRVHKGNKEYIFVKK